jgi:hypothetical protein
VYQIRIDLAAQPIVSYRYDHIFDQLLATNGDGIVYPSEHQVSSSSCSSLDAVVQIAGDVVPLSRLDCVDHNGRMARGSNH